MEIEGVAESATPYLLGSGRSHRLSKMGSRLAEGLEEKGGTRGYRIQGGAGAL